jgi:hypothetical protein
MSAETPVETPAAAVVVETPVIEGKTAEEVQQLLFKAVKQGASE